MDREQAKLLLQLCRPGCAEDFNDPEISKAYALLAEDAALREWFEAQQAFDSLISEQLAEVTPPADLKASILVGMRAHANRQTAVSAEATLPFEPASENTPAEAVTPSRLWWQKPWIGIAAIFLVLFFIVSLPKATTNTQVASSEAANASLVPDVVNFLAEEIDGLKIWDFDKRGKDASELKSYLASNNRPTPSYIPGSLNNLPTIGCVSFQHNETNLSMICFKGEQVYHLITLRREDYTGELGNQPQMYECKGQAFKIWADQDQVFILSVEGTKQNLPDII